MENDIYAEVKDRKGEIVCVGNYHASFKKSTLKLFKRRILIVLMSMI